MRIVSFNINGIRARLHQLAAVIEQLQPDLLGLQEIKVADESFPLEAVQALGMDVVYHGQKGHYGVALLSRKPPSLVAKGFPQDEDDAQRRLIMGRWPLADGRTLTLYNGYFPQGESRDHPVKFPAKKRFYADLNAHLANSHNSANDLVAVIGDMNISSVDNDIGIGEENAKRWLRTGKCSFLPEERQWMQALLGLGYVDSFRRLYPDITDQFSWFDYRSRGFDDNRGLRIDLVLASAALNRHCVAAGIDYQIRSMESPSDHAPVWAEFDLSLA
ncbi:MAG: exodeoxyribonuclease III [Gammaproteobacteria bacterium]|nr:exodeoxyribonuclease III [Gammaproteobacteria bacterium]